ncbi:DUF4870 domain-containing protein [Haloarchaeobius litoreus]|uniref:DUF4870 domain-containing protein n=1 Tax=Haloarchaeobius litoreus TaxID=755306 RepID=A0ABD6DDE4_9EURY|nr:DUF4870 domain-containing protein [Haloarchaeobius litoreus]
MATDERGTSDISTTTETGLEPNVAGAVAYLFGFVSGIAMLLIDGDNEFVRFHAIQSIAFNVVVVAVYVALAFVSLFLSFLPVVGDLLSLLFTLVYPVVGFVAFAGWLFLMYRAYEGDRFELPVLGSIAASQ